MVVRALGAVPAPRRGTSRRSFALQARAQAATQPGRLPRTKSSPSAKGTKSSSPATSSSRPSRIVRPGCGSEHGPFSPVSDLRRCLHGESSELTPQYEKQDHGDTQYRDCRKYDNLHFASDRTLRDRPGVQYHEPAWGIPQRVVETSVGSTQVAEQVLVHFHAARSAETSPSMPEKASTRCWALSAISASPL